jgi:hypothetical protein
MGDLITMSNRELSRVEVCQRLVEKRLKQAEAASLLSISVRHLKRLHSAMQELGIEIICANTPQAKGRVERVNQTLQDRLVKQMRLRGICNIEQGNEYLPEFIEAFNEKFAVAAKSPSDLHRPLIAGAELARALRVKTSRVLSKNLQFSYKRMIYRIVSKRPRYALRYQRVWVYERAAGEVEVEYKGKPLEYHIQRRPPRQSEVADAKQVQEEKRFKPVKRKQVPPTEHPRRNFRLPGSRPPKPVEKR